jgi:hypothetical protein
MRGRHDARVRQRCSALAALALLIVGGPSRVGAQADVPLGVRRELDPLSASSLRAMADLSLCRAMDCERTVSAALEVAPSARWRLTAEGTAGRSVVQPTLPLAADARFDLFYGDTTRRIWIGRGTAQSREIVSPGSGLNHWMEYGAAARWRSVSVSVDVSAGSQAFVGTSDDSPETKVYQSLDSATGVLRVDTVLESSSASAGDRTRWSSTALRLGWRSDQWRIGAVLGRASSSTGRPVVWSATEAERRLGRALGIVVSLGTYPGSFVTPAPRSRWMLGAGVSVATGRRSRQPSTPPVSTSATGRFVAIRVSSDRYRIVAHLPDAQRVELAADFTGWQPIPLRRDSVDSWSAELPAAPGLHHVSLRIDGGPWVAPSGLVAEEDGFGGSAGAFVIP